VYIGFIKYLTKKEKPSEFVDSDGSFFQKKGGIIRDAIHHASHSSRFFVVAIQR